jgi:thymidylate synthase (FAD)
MPETKLIGITKPVIGELKSTSDMVAFVARVSNPQNQFNTLTASKLLKYLIKHKHWSPFEMVNLVIEITTTRDIARQILRHRSFSFQEFSQRYADPTMLGFDMRETRLQDEKNRQNSLETDDEKLKRYWSIKQKQIIHETGLAYQWAIENGIAKEQARAILPEGLISSRMYMNGTLRSWIHYCHLRMGIETQKEHREIAELCWKIITREFPELKELLIEE